MLSTSGTKCWSMSTNWEPVSGTHANVREVGVVSGPLMDLRALSVMPEYGKRYQITVVEVDESGQVVK